MRVYDWDEEKRRLNNRELGIDFTAVYGFDWDTCAVEIDDRENYGELREIATGFIGDVLHMLVYTESDAAIRVISLRKASRRERQRYGQGPR